MPKTPGYRKRHDRNQAIVTLTDAETGKRRDYWLGEYGSAESRELYHRVVAEWEANGRRLFDPGFEQPPTARAGSSGRTTAVQRWGRKRRAGHAASNVNGRSEAHLAGEPGDTTGGITIMELCVRFWRQRASQLTENDRGHFKAMIRMLRRAYGSLPAEDFGPRRLQRLREDMIRPDPESGRRGWGVSYTNAQVGRLCRMFKWAAAEELVSASVRTELLSVDRLKPGKCAARAGAPVRPVPVEVVERTLPHMASPVAAIVRLQLLTGARPEEILSLRQGDIERDAADGVWLVRPEKHKTRYMGHDRVIMLGPKAQAVLEPFMDRAADAYLFSPAEADAERRAARSAARKTPLSCGNRAGTNRRAEPKRTLGDRYNARSYYRAVQYACDVAFPPPPPLAKRHDETREQWRNRLVRKDLKADLDAWRKKHRWFPYQLRHTAATNLRREHGLEASALVLGHGSAHLTDAVYAERDHSKVVEIMKRVG